MTEAWAPSVENVGALLRARTMNNNGAEIGTFTPATRPTDSQVRELINSAATDVADALGKISPKYYRAAASVTTFGAAMMVELSYFPEQVGTVKSPYAQLKAWYDDRLKRLVQLVSSDATEDTPGQEYMNPAGSFVGQIYPTTWYTEW